MGGGDDDAATRLKRPVQEGRPALAIFGQVAKMALHLIHIEMREVQKVGGVATVVAPGGIGQVSDVGVMYITARDLGHILLGDKAFGTPAKIAYYCGGRA